jgi:hypothetical protein
MNSRYKLSLAEYELPSFKCADGRVLETIFCKGGKTGRKAHLASAGSSCLSCGHWCKYLVSNWKLTAQQADQLERCEKCFGSKWLETEVL